MKENVMALSTCYINLESARDIGSKILDCYPDKRSSDDALAGSSPCSQMDRRGTERDPIRGHDMT